jgi:hypothetical protein
MWGYTDLFSFFVLPVGGIKSVKFIARQAIKWICATCADVLAQQAKQVSACNAGLFSSFEWADWRGFSNYIRLSPDPRQWNVNIVSLCGLSARRPPGVAIP